MDDAEAVLRLEELGITEPDSLKYLPMMPVLHDLVCEKDEPQRRYIRLAVRLS